MMLRSCTPSCALFASALIACSSLATGYSFAPSLRAPHGALRSASGACVARPPSRGLSALSMMSKDDAPEEPSGLVLPGMEDFGGSGLVLPGMDAFDVSKPDDVEDVAPEVELSGSERKIKAALAAMEAASPAAQDRAQGMENVKSRAKADMLAKAAEEAAAAAVRVEASEARAKVEAAEKAAIRAEKIAAKEAEEGK